MAPLLAAAVFDALGRKWADAHDVLGELPEEDRHKPSDDSDLATDLKLQVLETANALWDEVTGRKFPSPAVRGSKILAAYRQAKNERYTASLERQPGKKHCLLA